MKIYPPNGFRPYGNVRWPLHVPGAPTPVQLDQALLAFWRACARDDIPVMAHSGHSMGEDDAHDDMAAPAGWQALLQALQDSPDAVINAGHFGGDRDNDDWSDQLVRLMSQPGGSRLYADLGYWEDLRCNDGPASCRSRARLEAALLRNPVARKRVMYGSDWLMLARERRWDQYPADLAESTRGLISADDLFAGNALRCFTRLQP